jgi:DNA-binding CsgD family transcriptional regulator
VVRQLFERRLLMDGDTDEAEQLLAGPAASARFLLGAEQGSASSRDASFAVLHGLYWLAANFSIRQRLVVAIDDAHWADSSSLRWLAYLAPRLEGLALALLVALRPAELASGQDSLPAVRAKATAVLRPRVLSQEAVTTLARQRLGSEASDELCEALTRASGGNPLYVAELLRSVVEDVDVAQIEPDELLSRGAEGLTGHVALRIRSLDPQALSLAQAFAVLGDGCELRHAAALAHVNFEGAQRLAAGLVRLEVLAGVDPPRFLHPIVREAVEASLGIDGRQAVHRSAARLLHFDGAAPGRIAAHLARVQPAGEPWVVWRLREAAGAAVQSGEPQIAVELLRRALVEPPPVGERVDLLRELARAEADAGRETAVASLELALAMTADRRQRAEITLEVAETYAALFRWVDAVDLIERALEELGDADPELAARLEGELVVAGVHDARRSSVVAPVLKRLGDRHPSPASAEALTVAQGMASALAGHPAQEAAGLLEGALRAATPPVGNWDTRAALLWSLVVAERFEAVEAALEEMLDEVHRSGSARGLIATYSTLGLLKLRLGALPEGDAASGVALRVLQEGDFAPGLPFAATVLADIAVECGNLEEAQALLDLLPQEGWSAGVATVLIPAARGRLHLAQDRPAEALADFQICGEMFSVELWGVELRDVGYLHARSGAAQALLRLGQREPAYAWAEEELADVRVFGTPRAMGVACRVAGLAHGGEHGMELLGESVAVLEASPAQLERAKSLVELGAALRRSGHRAAARDRLADGLDLAARSGARPVARRAREELQATGARPRRELRRGTESLTPSELRIARMAAKGKTNREIAHSLYVTLKTVEGHLARCYGKLGISGRSELGAALGEEKTRVPTP